MDRERLQEVDWTILIDTARDLTIRQQQCIRRYALELSSTILADGKGTEPLECTCTVASA